MAALTKDRATPQRDGARRAFGLAADAVIYAGALVVVDAGYALAGSTDTGLVCVGVAKQAVDNTDGANGAVKVEVERGVFRFANSSSGDLIAVGDIGATCYIVDDQTVAKTNGSSSRSAAGKVFDVDAQGVWVEI